MAKDILDKQLLKCDPKAPVVIEVFGGEAFANFKLIKEIEEYVSSQYSHLHVMYETTTNGTLVRDFTILLMLITIHAIQIAVFRY